MKENFVSRQQLQLLPERVQLAQNTCANSNLKSYISQKLKGKRLIVGAGGSYPAAICGAYVLEELKKQTDIEVQTPQTAIRLLTQNENLYRNVIVISYSGTSPDIINLCRICHKLSISCALVTGENKDEIRKKYEEFGIREIDDEIRKEYEKVGIRDLFRVISYFSENDKLENAKEAKKELLEKERGMISMFSTLAPATIFGELIEKKELSMKANMECFKLAERFVQNLNLNQIAKDLKRAPTIHVFYEQDTLASARDIEVKFISSGIANVVLHEKKNFSHGRYTCLYQLKFGLVINLLKGKIRGIHLTEYDNLLRAFLKERCVAENVEYLEIGQNQSPISTAIWNIESMSIIPYLLVAIGEELRIDVSKPLTTVPEEAKSLYNYVGDF